MPFFFQAYTGVGPPLVIAAENVTDVPAQITLPGLTDILTVGKTDGFTVIVISLLTTVAGLAHAKLVVMVQFTTSPLASVVLVYVLVLLPTILPFTFHTYVGVGPPLVGVAVNVTEVPAQIVLPGLTEILTAGVTGGDTVMVIVLLAIVAGVAHSALLVSVHCITSPLFNAAFV